MGRCEKFASFLISKTKENRKMKLPSEKKKRRQHLARIMVLTMLFILVVPTVAFADPATEGIKSATNWLVGIFRGAGGLVSVIAIGFFFASLNSQDGSQRLNSILGIATGIALFFLKEILAVFGVSL